MSVRLIEPPQKTPFNQPRGEEPFDRTQEIFSRVWWLFWDAMARAINDLEDAADDAIVVFTPAADCVKGVMGAMTALDNALTTVAPDPRFTRAMIGRPISVFGAGSTVYAKNAVPGSMTTLAAGDILLSTIVDVSADGRTATLGNVAVNTVEQAQWACGTDNAPAFNGAMATLRAKRGGTLLFNPNGSGDCYFATVGWVGVFGDNYIDRVDFNDLQIIQGEYNIVIGAPMGLLEINQSVFNQWALVESGPPIADITAPVEKGKYIIEVNPAQLVDGDGNLLFHRDDYILIYTGYIGTFYFGFNLPDAQICQMVFADVNAGTIILAEPTLKPFIQELYPNWTGSASTPPTPGTDAPFAVMNVTDIIIRNFKYSQLKLETFFFTDLLTGGQCTGLDIDRADLLTRGTWYSMNYVRRGITSGVRAFIDNLASPRLPFDYAFTFAVGSSQVLFKDSEIDSTGTTYLHIHEGAADCRVQNVTLGNFNGNPDAFGIQPVSIRGRSYDLKVLDCHFSGWDTVGVIYIDESCIVGGLIWNCTIFGRGGAFTSLDVECYGENWRIDCPELPADRIYQKSTNIQPFILRESDALLNSAEAAIGLSTSLGGFGKSGNILRYSDDLTGLGWNAAAGVTVTPNTTDIADPLGGFTASKVETGATSANMEVSYDALTPAPGVVTGTGDNADRTFILVFYVYSFVENLMECFLGSFVPGPGLDLTNTLVRKIGVYPQWQRVEVQITFDSSAVTGTEILSGLASAVTAPVVGLSSTFYFWGVTLQEVSGPKALVTEAVGAQVDYGVGVYALNGKILQVLNLAGVTASLPLKVNATNDVISELISMTAAADVNVSGLTDQQPVIRNGTALGSAAGVDKSTTIVTLVTQNIGSISYQSGATGVSFLTSVNTTSESSVFTKGIRTT